jgi:circadian clock protein KaiC
LKRGGGAGQEFVWGVDALDKLIGRSLMPGVTVVIAGPPGAGKTVLASTICYHNALRGNRCLYISFQEHYEKFLLYMRRLGMDFEELRRRELFHYEGMPVLADPSSLASLLEDIGARVLGNGEFKVVVVDSVTPISSLTGAVAKAREVFTNFFYNLAKLKSGIIVLVAEARSEDLRELQGLDYVADVVLLLRYRTVRGFMNRFMEVKKARGSPIYLAEIPFSIIEGKGIAVHMPPPMLREIPPPQPEKMLKPPCTVMERVFGFVPVGSTISIFHQADARGQHLLTPILIGLVLLNRMRTLFISYAYSPDEIVERLLSWLPNEVRGDVRSRLLDSGLLKIVSLNPGSLSLSEIYSLEMSEVEEFKPDLVVFDRTDIPYLIHGEIDMSTYITSLRNELMSFRHKHITIIRSQVEVDERFYRINASMSNVVLRISYREHGRQYEPVVYVWRENSAPRLVESGALDVCARQVLERIRAMG